jgi:hypothetical protein
MSAIRFRVVIAIAGLVTLGTAGAQGQTGLRPLRMAPSAPEVLGLVPNHFVWLRPGLQAVQDPLDLQLVFLDDEGRVTGRSALPPRFSIDRIVSEPDRVRYVDAAGRTEVVVERSIEPALVFALSAAAVANGRSARAAQVVRSTPQRLFYRDERQPRARQLDIRSVSDGTLAQVYEIGFAGGSHRYLVSEEIAASSPLQVHAFAQRFDQAGRLTGVAHLPLDEMDVVPRNFVTVTDEGVLRLLVPAAAGVKIREIEFSPPPAAGPRRGTAAIGDYRSFGRATREIAVDTLIEKMSGAGQFRSNGARFRIRVATPPITRDRVLANARAYLNVNWTLAQENFAKPGIENLCQPAEAKFWLRPFHFTPASIGTTIGPMPYRWGGDDTPESFRLRIDWGALAGDICTCRDPAFDYCLTPESAGVDCSGFVSRAWGIEKRGTAGLLDVATELNGFSQLRPGDAFNRPGRHVRLFVGMQPGALIAFTVLESSLRLDCEGVCERSYRPSEMNGYRLIRYRGIAN